MDKKQIPAELWTYYEKIDLLSLEEDILMWQEWIIVPSTFRKTVLSVLHDGHPGIWTKRALSRFYVWW